MYILYIGSEIRNIDSLYTCMHVISVQAVSELGDWNGQCPPTAKHQKGKIITPKIKDIIGKVHNILWK